MFELRGAGKSYAGQVALAPTDLELAAGRTTVLIGPSGCGKSTLLRLLVGLVAPDTGVIHFGGEPLTPERLPAVRLRLGYVIQDGGLFPHLTARENVALVARHVGWTAERVTARLAELCDLTHLPTDALDRFPTQLSGGQRQRVSLMRALMLDPEVILLDEPLGALDPLVRAELQAELRDLFRTLGKTVVMVTHDLAEAAWFGHEIVLLKAGAVEQRGPYADLSERPASPFVERFVTAQQSLHLG